MKPLKTLFLASILFSLHAALLDYIHSSMLASFVSESAIGLYFTCASIVALVLLFVAPKLERIFGAYKILTTTLLVSSASLIILGTTHHTIGTFIFVLYFALNTIVWYNFNLLIEHFALARTMGSLRGLYLSLTNFTWIGAPIIAGYIISIGGVQRPYLFAAVPVFLSAVLLLMHKTLGSRERDTRSHSIKEALTLLKQHKPLQKILSITWILQIFYALMSLFMAPYLQSLGFSWGQIGIIFSIMLVPFVLFEFPVGRYLDTHRNEKHLLVFALALIAFTVVLLLAPLSTSMWYFAFVLFVSRIGASIVEVTTDSYFFRHIQDTAVGLASLYQSALPLAYLIAPLVGGIIFSFGGFHLLLSIFCAIMLASALYAFTIE